MQVPRSIRLALTGAALCAAQAAGAQQWPVKPVRMLVTFPPGGPSEIVTRMLNERLQGALKQPFVLENRVGATGNVGADAGAKGPPDPGRQSTRLNSTHLPISFGLLRSDK